MKLLYWWRVPFMGLVALALLIPLAAQASSRLALDQGCYACHGAYRRGDAPALDQLPKRLERLKGNAVAEKDFLEKYGRGELLEHIDAHERISPRSAAVLVHWLVEGAK